MNIGIFGGAFNPVHNGHLALVERYVRLLSLDKVILVPTADPPHKSGEALIDGEHRANMLRLAMTDTERYEISDIEFHREGKSYSYDTICQLKAEYPDAKFYMIIGSDQYFYFHNWYRASDILSMVTVVTAAREDNEYSQLLEYRAQHPGMADSIVANFDVIEVSSSQIRDLVSKGQNIEHLVPPTVAGYIKDNNLYV